MTNPSVLTAALDEYVSIRAAAIAKARAELAVSELEARALRCIADEPGIRPSVLRARLGVTAACVTTMVDRLIVRGLVRRELDVEDRRVNHIHLEIDLDQEPWAALGRFCAEVDAAARAERREDIEAAAHVLSRLTDRVRALA